MLWHPIELSFQSSRAYNDPYLGERLEVCWTSEAGRQVVVPGFWDGAQQWKARFAPDEPGHWSWKSSFSDRSNDALHAREGRCLVQARQEAGDVGNALRAHGFLKAGPNGRGFVHADGTPFFWLGDTVWAAASHASLQEWREYTLYRAKQGYNVAQINTLPQWDAAVGPHRLPFAQASGSEDVWDLGKPAVAYYHHLDRLVQVCAEHGIVPALTVLWCNYVPGTNPSWTHVPRTNQFTPQLAEAYGAYLAARYAAYGAVWLVSGDTDWGDPEAVSVYDAAGEAIRRACPYPLLTAHLNGGLSTPEALNALPWLDFHMYQSCHIPSSPAVSVRFAEQDRMLEPPRPVLNGEPCYDRMQFIGKKADGRMVDRELVRRTAWVSLLAGGNAGYTYGAHGLWPWFREGDAYPFERYGQPLPWQQALRLASGEDMAVLKRFFQQLNWWELQPAQQLLASDAEAADEARVAVDDKDRHAVVYVSGKRQIRLLLPEHRLAEWIDPCSGESLAAASKREQDGSTSFEYPAWEHDAVLWLHF